MDEQAQPRANYYRLLRRGAGNRWRLILFVSIAVAIPMTVNAIIAVPKTYEAAAKIFFEDEKLQRDSNLLREWLPVNASSFQLALLRSHSVAEAVIEALSQLAKGELLGGGMKQDYIEQAQNFIRWLRGAELVFPPPKTRILDELQIRGQFTQAKSGEA